MQSPYGVPDDLAATAYAYHTLQIVNHAAKFGVQLYCQHDVLVGIGPSLLQSVVGLRSQPEDLRQMRVLLSSNEIVVRLVREPLRYSVEEIVVVGAE